MLAMTSCPTTSAVLPRQRAIAPITPMAAVPFFTAGTCAVPRRSLTEAQLCDWIADARVGESIQYHEGLLLRDRSEVASALQPKERNSLHAVARRAWVACELGLVHLFSIKLGDDHYRYLALRSASPLLPAGAVVSPTCTH